MRKELVEVKTELRRLSTFNLYENVEIPVKRMDMQADIVLSSQKETYVFKYCNGCDTTKTKIELNIASAWLRLLMKNNVNEEYKVNPVLVMPDGKFEFNDKLEDGNMFVKDLIKSEYGEEVECSGSSVKNMLSTLSIRNKRFYSNIKVS